MKILHIHRMKYIVFLLFALAVSCETPKSDPSLDHSPQEIEIFAPGLISTSLYERDMAISSQGDEIIYSLGDYKQTRRCLVRLVKKEGTWGEKEILSFSGQYQDIEPFFSPDDQQLFFASNRPINGDTERSDYNIWVSGRTGQNWSDPKPLSSNINTEKDEFYPSVSNNGNLYFTATREEGPGREDIYVSHLIEGEYQIPVPLDTNINTAVYEFNAYISPGEDLLIFSSYGRQDDLGGGDLYISRKDENGRWSKAQNMGRPINSDKLDYCPFVDWSRNNLYFTSERFDPVDKRINTVGELSSYANNVLNGMGNIYRINLNILEIK